MTGTFYYIFLPVISSLIGWMTNVVAIRLLFRPYRPVKLFWWTFQGMLPKHRKELAASVGEIIEGELISAEEIAARIKLPEVRSDISRAVTQVTRKRLAKKIPFFVPRSVSLYLLDKLEDIIRLEVDEAIEEILEELLKVINKRVNVAEIVREKISALELERLEQLVYSANGRELRHIEFLGAVIGFIVGLMQLGLVVLLRSG